MKSPRAAAIVLTAFGLVAVPGTANAHPGYGGGDDVTTVATDLAGPGN